MTKERCMTLLDQVIDHVIVGQNTKGAIHELLQIGFTKNELIHEFSFAKEDVEQVQEE